MRARSLDRRVTIQTFTESQDSAGEPIKTWVDLVRVSARRMDVMGKERFASDQRIATRACRYRLRYRPGVTEEMQIVDGDQVYAIKGIASDERRRWMELSAEAINPEATP
jgi:SPP1 family predicted phage head-tail adaptor